LYKQIDSITFAPNYKPLKTFLLAIALVVGIYYSALAQIGIKASLLTPRGDIGQTFKKGMSYELFFLVDSYNDHLRSRIGIGHSTLQPRMAAFPVYVIKGEHTLLPGSATYSNLNLNYLFLDEDLRLFHYKGFSIYAGIGLTFGLASFSYNRHIETLVYDGEDMRDNICGIRGNLQADYIINKHFIVFAEAMHSAVTETHWAVSYSNETYSIGVNYRIKSK
jgi:hypothetical protein